MQALMEVLVDNGHEVVELSPFPLKVPRANYTDLDLSKHFPSLVNTLTFEQMTSLTRFQGVENIVKFAGPELCRKVFETQHFKEVMSGKHGKFDVVFTEIFGSDCWTVVAFKLNVHLCTNIAARSTLSTVQAYNYFAFSSLEAPIDRYRDDPRLRLDA